MQLYSCINVITFDMKSHSYTENISFRYIYFFCSNDLICSKSFPENLLEKYLFWFLIRQYFVHFSAGLNSFDPPTWGSSAWGILYYFYHFYFYLRKTNLERKQISFACYMTKPITFLWLSECRHILKRFCEMVSLLFSLMR